MCLRGLEDKEQAQYLFLNRSRRDNTAAAPGSTAGGTPHPVGRYLHLGGRSVRLYRSERPSQASPDKRRTYVRNRVIHSICDPAREGHPHGPRLRSVLTEAWARPPCVV